MKFGFVFILILMFFVALVFDTSAPMRNPVDITSISPSKN